MFYMGRRKARQVFLGDKRVERIFLGETELWGHYVYVTQSLEGLTSNAPEKMLYGRPLTIVFTPDTGKQLVPSTVVVSMGGVDVTESVYNLETNQIEIPSVTNVVSITAVAKTIDAAYIPLLYIRTKGKAYGAMFELPYHINSNTKLEMDINLNLTTYTALFSVLGNVTRPTSSSPNAYFVPTVHNTSVWKVAWGHADMNTNSNYPVMKHGERIKFVADRGTFTYKNQSNYNFQLTLNGGTWNITSQNLKIMAIANSSFTQYGWPCDGKLYGVKISEPTNDNDNILLDYVPVVRLSDGAIGIYDTINGNIIVNNSYIAPYADVTTTLSNSSATLLSDNATGAIRRAVYGKTWICKYTPSSGYTFNSDDAVFQVTINNEDVTSDVAVYDSTTDTWTVTLVAHWNDSISITGTAQADPNAVQSVSNPNSINNIDNPNDNEEETI